MILIVWITLKNVCTDFWHKLVIEKLNILKKELKNKDFKVHNRNVINYFVLFMIWLLTVVDQLISSVGKVRISVGANCISKGQVPNN